MFSPNRCRVPLVLVILICGCSLENKDKAREEWQRTIEARREALDKARHDSLVAVADSCLHEGDLNCAQRHLAMAATVLSGQEASMSLLKQIGELNDMNLCGVLTDMSEEDYSKLCKRQLERPYVKNTDLNKMYIDRLYKKRSLRRDCLVEVKATEVEIAQARVQDEAQGRKEFAARLRTQYLDEGLDIKVRVAGGRADRLILSYVLIDDVWVHHFKKNGNLTLLRKLGFTRVDLQNGYDYHVYYDL